MYLSPILLLISFSIVGVFSTPPSSHVHTSKLDTFQPDLSFSNLPQPSYDSKLENSVLQQSLPGFNSGTYKLPQTSYSDPHSISPLYISPLLQSGQNLLAQDLSRVTSLIPGVPEAGYSAFITVDAASGTHLHFWFIPKENCEHWRQEPTTLWLQGGYGLSTLRGALQENLVLFNVTEDGHMGKFDHGLTRYMNILMVDNAGVGFSHTQDPNYIVTDYNFIAEELYAVLTQIFLLFPELKRSVYIGGTSAGASKVTATAELVLNRDPEVVRLAGVIIGDGVTDLETDLSLQAEYLHNLGMIEKKVVRNVTNILEDGHALKNTGNKFEADGIFFDQYVDEINRHIGYKDKDLQDVLRAFRFRDHWLDFLEQDEIREKLHVGRLPFVLTDPKAAGFLSGSPSKTNGEILEIILNRRVPVMRYQGQYDALLTYQSTIASMRNLNWYGQACLQSEQFRRSQIWFEGKLFGYQRKCHNLWEVFALRAAHVVQLAVARPFWAFVWDWVKERESDAGKLPQ